MAPKCNVTSSDDVLKKRKVIALELNLDNVKGETAMNIDWFLGLNHLTVT